jgi:hypothetical protein
MHRPFVETDGKVTQQLGVSGRLAVDVEREAVQERLIDDRQASLPQPPTARVEPDPHRQTVLAGQRHGQVKDVRAAAIGQAVEVQMGRRQPGIDDGVDLRAELQFNLVGASSGEGVERPRRMVGSRD